MWRVLHAYKKVLRVVLWRLSYGLKKSLRRAGIILFAAAPHAKLVGWQDNHKLSLGDARRKFDEWRYYYHEVRSRSVMQWVTSAESLAK